MLGIWGKKTICNDKVFLSGSFVREICFSNSQRCTILIHIGKVARDHLSLSQNLSSSNVIFYQRIIKQTKKKKLISTIKALNSIRIKLRIKKGLN